MNSAGRAFLPWLLPWLLMGCSLVPDVGNPPQAWSLLDCRFHAGAPDSGGTSDSGIPIRFGVPLQRQGWSGVGHRGRIVADVTVPELSPRGPFAVSVGNVGNAAELLWNGERIAQAGSLDRPGTPSPGSLLWGLVERDRIRIGPGSSNRIEIRFVNTAGAAGMVGGPAGIFLPQDLEHHRRVRELGRSMLRGGSVALCGIWTVLLWAGRASGWRARELLGASAPTVCLGLLGLFRSPWLVEWLGSGGVPRFVEGLLTLLLPLCFYGHFRSVFRPARRWIDWTLVGVTCAYVLGFGRLSALGHGWAVAGLAGVLAAVATAVYGLGLSAHRDGDPDARVLMAAWTVQLVLAALQLLPAWFGGIPFAALPLWFSDILAPAWVLSLGGLTLRAQRLAQIRESAWRERLLQAHLEERRRIGIELHDGIAQDLEAVRLQTRLQGAAAPWASELAGVLGGAVSEIRRLSADLQPIGSDTSAVEHAIRSMSRADGKPVVEVQVEAGSIQRLEIAALEQVHRMTQEAVRNAIRHARADRIRVSLESEDTRIRLRVEDDGCGFDPSKASGRLGLGYLRDRALLCGAQFSIRSSPGAGCRLEVRFPVAEHLKGEGR